jgi:hypothetical protein
VLAVVIAVDRATGHHQGLLTEASLIPWLLALAVALLVLGFLTAVGCKNMTVAAAERERETAETAMRDRVADVTRDLVLVPTGREIAQYEHFRKELAVASAVLFRSLCFPALFPAPGSPGAGARCCAFPLAAGRWSPVLCFPARRRALEPGAFPRRSAQTASLLSPGTGAPFGSRGPSPDRRSPRSQA